MRYLPGKENITGVNVTVHSLSSSSFYLFRVYSVGELNEQEQDKNKWNYAEVFVETEGEGKCELQDNSSFVMSLDARVKSNRTLLSQGFSAGIERGPGDKYYNHNLLNLTRAPVHAYFSFVR